jgi:hypothetical protein
MNGIIRDARIEDAEAIRLLNRDGLGYDYPLWETAEKLSALLQGRHCRIFMF